MGPSLLTSAVSKTSTGIGGNVDITTDFLSVDNNAQITASTAGQRNAGKINIQATQKVSLTNNGQIRSTVEPTATGDGNQIGIQGRSLSMTNGARITTQTQGRGKAGNIFLDIKEDITLSGKNTGIFASTSDSLVEQNIGVVKTEDGEAGQLLDTAQNLTLQPGTFVTSISGEVNNNNDVDLYKIFLSGGQTFSATTVEGATFDTQLFLFDVTGRGVYANDDNPSIRQSTLPEANTLTPTQPGFYYLGISSYNNDPQSGMGRIFDTSDFTVAPIKPGGDLPLSSWNNAGNSSGNYTISLRGTAVAIPQSVLQASGDGGNITIKARSVFATNSARVAASTFGQGNAGDTSINTQNTIFLDGEGTDVSANTAPNLISKAGDLTINTNTLQLQNQASLTVSSPQGQAGNLTVNAKTVLLNQASLTAETGITGDEEGANITLKDLNLLLMQNNSRISARASSTAKGGNITIDAAKGFAIATPLEDNDIIASASRGQGGNITIDAQRIFGLAQRRAILGNKTNDIDASSEFSNPGTVTLNTLYLD
ncbi:hypothetical protein [Scytonema sp. NUACC26]|uniref:hypothetical protein n=1 Tax=Scytonema sp. NUACC26 TaxID=3140176 RepID=UPI0038B3D684